MRDEVHRPTNGMKLELKDKHPPSIYDRDAQHDDREVEGPVPVRRELLEGL